MRKKNSKEWMHKWLEKNMRLLDILGATGSVCVPAINQGGIFITTSFKGLSPHTFAEILKSKGSEIHSVVLDKYRPLPHLSCSAVKSSQRCNQCNYEFDHKGYLRTHKTMHIGENSVSNN